MYLPIHKNSTGSIPNICIISTEFVNLFGMLKCTELRHASGT